MPARSVDINKGGKIKVKMITYPAINFKFPSARPIFRNIFSKSVKQNMESDKQKSKSNEKSQFGLLTTRRFAPFFSTQFLGAFNDNVYKNALVLLIAWSTVTVIADNADRLINFSAGIFILPFFLFAAIAGQLADKYDKGKIIRWIKLAEIVIMGCATIAFFFDSFFALILILFLMGTQSSFFAPVKYSIIPDHLKPKEIVGGNAMVGMSTNVSILLGTIIGGLLIQIEHEVSFRLGNMTVNLDPRMWICLVVCFTAFVGWLSSRYIPSAPPPSPDLKISWNPFTQAWKTIQYGRKVHSVFLSILAISWFWFLGMAYLTQLPKFTNEVLQASKNVYIVLMSMFIIGTGLGALLCEKLSGRKVELGLVPLGSIGLSIFGCDLFFSYTTPAVGSEIGLVPFLQTPGNYRILFDLLMIGVFGGFYYIPLLAFIQKRTAPEYRSRVIAASNIMNALFMVMSAGAGFVLLGYAGLTIPQFFLVLALANVLVAIYIYTVVPEFVVRFLIWMLTHTMYRVKHTGFDNIPDEGAAVIVCNHVSYVDGPLIGGACRRPVRFVMFEPIYKLPVLNFIFRTGKAIPINSQRKNPETFEKAFEQIAQALDDGEVICIFPEGRLTTDGETARFRKGIEKIIERNPVPVVPMALKGMWGSFFSHKGGPALTGLPKRFWSKIELVAGEPVMPEDVTAAKMQEAVEKLIGKYQ